MSSLNKKVIVRDSHRIHLQKIFGDINALTLTTDNMTEINLRKYQKNFIRKMKNVDDEIVDLIDEEHVDRNNSEVDSSSKQIENTNEVLVKLKIYYQNRTELKIYFQRRM